MAADTGWSCPRQEAAAINTTHPNVTDAERGRLIDGYAVIVLTPAGKCRRRIMLSLHSAQLAVERARARGQVAELVLCRLTPLESPTAGSGDLL